MIRRRKKWTPPPPDPDEREKAQSAVAEAVGRLTSAIARQPEIDHAARTQRKIRRENHMAPRISRALGAHGD